MEYLWRISFHFIDLISFDMYTFSFSIPCSWILLLTQYIWKTTTWNDNFGKTQNTHKFILISRVGCIHHVPSRFRRPRFDPPDAWLGQRGSDVPQFSLSFPLVLQEDSSTGVIICNRRRTIFPLSAVLDSERNKSSVSFISRSKSFIIRKDKIQS